MNKRTNISSGAKWEELVSYSRAVKIGNIVAVSGTTAADDNNDVVGADDPYKQTAFILEKIKKALDKLDVPISAVIRSRIYVSNIYHWEEIGKAHKEFFENVKPATTMVEVSRLIDSNFLVEIEVDAVV